MPDKPSKRTHHDIMLSSTSKDLERHREVVIDAITHLGLFPQAMELDSALPEDLIEGSLNKVRIADAYVGIIGYRYGQTPEDPTRNPDKLSLTELEYNEAEKRSLPICMFVMSDDHPIPRSAIREEAGETHRLDAFRLRASKDHIHAEFESVEDLKAKAMQSLVLLRERLDEASPSSILTTSEESSIPAAPTLFPMPPYAPGHAFIGRIRELQLLSDWAVAPKEPVLVLEAIGGMGKSMICWEWVNHHASKVRPDFAGAFWYSFYERGADMSDFCAYTLAYISGRPIAEFKKRKTADLANELIPLLRKRSWLLVLDGLERVLVAYHRYDAAQVLDEDVESFDDSAEQKAEACIRPADSDLLRSLVGAGPSKFLISSRLMPLALLNNSGVERPGVAHKKLTGLDPLDAEAMLCSAGVKGNPAVMRRYLEKNFDCHPTGSRCNRRTDSQLCPCAWRLQPMGG
jgi:hypothetical protein